MGRRAFYPITDRQKCVESFNEGGVTVEKVGDALNNARGINPGES